MDPLLPQFSYRLAGETFLPDCWRDSGGKGKVKLVLFALPKSLFLYRRKRKIRMSPGTYKAKEEKKNRKKISHSAWYFTFLAIQLAIYHKINFVYSSVAWMGRFSTDAIKDYPQINVIIVLRLYKLVTVLKLMIFFKKEIIFASYSELPV